MKSLAKQLIEYFESGPRGKCDLCNKEMPDVYLQRMFRKEDDSPVVCYPCYAKESEKLVSKLFAPVKLP